MNRKALFIGSGTAIIILIVVALLVFFPNSQVDRRSLKIIDVNGECTVERSGKTLEASTDMPLQSGDTITVGSDGFARLMLDDDKFIYLHSDTLIDLIAEGNAEDSKTSVFIWRGSMMTEVKKKLSAASTYDVMTPNTTMSIRGTKTLTQVIEDAVTGHVETSNAVLEGQVKIKAVKVKADGTVVSVEKDLGAGEGNAFSSTKEELVSQEEMKSIADTGSSVSGVKIEIVTEEEAEVVFDVATFEESFLENIKNILVADAEAAAAGDEGISEEQIDLINSQLSEIMSAFDEIREASQSEISSAAETAENEPSSEPVPEFTWGTEPEPVYSDTVIPEPEDNTDTTPTTVITGDGDTNLVGLEVDEEAARLAEEERLAQEEADRLAEEERLAQEEADKLAKEEADRLAEEERLAQEEADRLAKEEADRLAEEERLAKEEADRLAEEERLAQEEEDRLAKEEADRLAEEERLAKEEADRLAEEERLAKEEADGEYPIEAPIVIPGGHKLIPVAEKPANCDEDGYEAYWQCSECEAMFSDADGKSPIDEPIVIPGGHKLTQVSGQPANCEEDGYEAYWQCSECEAMFSDADGEYPIEEPVVIPGGHIWGEPEWNWQGPESADATFTCERVPDHTETVEAYSIELQEDLCVEPDIDEDVAGKDVYMATVIHEGTEYTDYNEVPVQVIPEMAFPADGLYLCAEEDTTVEDLLAIAVSDFPVTYNGGEELDGSYIFEGDLLEYESTDPDLPSDSCEVTITFVPEKSNAFATVSETTRVHIITEEVVLDD